jgi:hypothetical protein
MATMTNTDHLPATVLKRKAVGYVRQSSQSQVQNNLESQRRQYDLVEEARRRGFRDIEVIDGAGADQSAEFKKVVPVAAIAGKPGSVEAEHGQDFPGAKPCHEPVETWPSHPLEAEIIILADCMAQLRRMASRPAQSCGRRHELSYALCTFRADRVRPEATLPPDQAGEEIDRQIIGRGVASTSQMLCAVARALGSSPFCFAW